MVNTLDKLTYFLKACKFKKFTKKTWLLQVLGVTQLPESPDSNSLPYDLFIQEGKLLTLDEQGNLIALEGYIENKPYIAIKDTIKVDSSMVPTVEGEIETTYGRLLANYMVLIYSFDDKVPYINTQWDIDDVGKKIAKLLQDDVVTVQQVRTYYRMAFFSSTLSTIVVPSVTRKALGTNPEIAKRKAQLLEEHKDNLDNPATIAKIEAELVKMDKEYLSDDESMGFYKSGKAFKNTRKQMYVIHGGETDMLDPSQTKLIPNSLEEGWDLTKLPELANSLRDGSYSRGAETALGGEAAKTIARVFQNVKIAEDDCEDVTGYPIRITNVNYKMLVGRYLVGKDEPLTEGQLKSNIDKTLVIRSPMACKTEGNSFCKRCMGSNVSASKTALSMMAVAVGSSFLTASLAKMHDTSLSTSELNIKEVLY